MFVARTGCSVARLARLLWEQKVAGSNPATPTLKRPRQHSVDEGVVRFTDRWPVVYRAASFFRSTEAAIERAVSSEV